LSQAAFVGFLGLTKLALNNDLDAEFRQMRKKLLPLAMPAQVIRRFSDGEVSGVFLCHGQPVRSDSLADEPPVLPS
jgi:hypothetical protein